jgi:hypothetical protein
MPRTNEQLEQAAAEAEAWLDRVVPDELGPPEGIADFRRVAAAMTHLGEAENKLRDMVAAARANGYSWGCISLVVGVSKQAARERFGTTGR